MSTPRVMSAFDKMMSYLIQDCLVSLEEYQIVSQKSFQKIEPSLSTSSVSYISEIMPSIVGKLSSGNALTNSDLFPTRILQERSPIYKNCL